MTRPAHMRVLKLFKYITFHIDLELAYFNLANFETHPGKILTNLQFLYNNIRVRRTWDSNKKANKLNRYRRFIYQTDKAKFYLGKRRRCHTSKKFHIWKSLYFITLASERTRSHIYFVHCTSSSCKTEYLLNRRQEKVIYQYVLKKKHFCKMES